MTANRGILRMEMPVGVPGIEWVIWWGVGRVDDSGTEFCRKNA